MPKATDPERFEGFADRDGRFFRALAKNQRRDWFLAHRDEYETGWNAPMKALLADLRERIDPLFPNHPLGAPKVFRIHRDVRFAKDKSPYKTHVGGFLAVGEGSGPSVPCALYVHVGAGERFAAAGHYVMDGPQLARFRAAVIDDATGKPLAALVAKLERAGFEAGAHAALQKVPRGVDPAHPRAALLKRKGLIMAFPPMPAGLLTEHRLVDWLVGHVKKTAPLVAWLADLAE